MRDIDPQNDLTFFRVRGKNKQEIMVAPDKNLYLIVLQRTDFDESWSDSALPSLHMMARHPNQIDEASQSHPK